VTLILTLYSAESATSVVTQKVDFRLISNGSGSYNLNKIYPIPSGPSI